MGVSKVRCTFPTPSIYHWVSLLGLRLNPYLYKRGSHTPLVLPLREIEDPFSLISLSLLRLSFASGEEHICGAKMRNRRAIVSCTESQKGFNSALEDMIQCPSGAQQMMFVFRGKVCGELRANIMSAFCVISHPTAFSPCLYTIHMDSLVVICWCTCKRTEGR